MVPEHEKPTYVSVSPRKRVSGKIMRPGSLRSVCSDQRYCFDELPSVHRLLDGVEVEHRAPRRPNPLHCGRRVVSRIGLSGHELRLPLARK